MEMITTHSHRVVLRTRKVYSGKWDKHMCSESVTIAIYHLSIGRVNTFLL